MRATIINLLESVYGESIFIDPLADEIVKIVNGENDFYHDEDRERSIMLRIWDFFSGGDTATYMASRIREKLDSDGEW